MLNRIIRQAAIAISIVALGNAVAEEAVTTNAKPPTTETFVQIGQAIDSLDSARLVELINGIPIKIVRSESIRSVPVTAWVLATASGDESSTKAVLSVAESDQWLTQTIKQLADDAGALKPLPISVEADAVTAESLAWSKQLRRDLLIAAVTGQRDRVKHLRDELVGKPLPESLLDELNRVADASQSIAEQLPPSITGVAVNLFNAVQQKEQDQQQTSDQLLGIYRATPSQDRKSLKLTRGDGTNAYSVLQAREQQRASLVDAYGKLYDSYWKGEISRIECMRKMQEVKSADLDLTQKRAIMIWTLRKMRAENAKEKLDQRIAANRIKTAALQERTASDLSSSWPSLFRHRALRGNADAMLRELKSYSPSNCGPLSICYAKCVTEMRVLHRLLQTDLDGIGSRQQAGLRTYLREIEEELQGPYQDAHSIASIKATASSDDTAIAASSKTDVAIPRPDSVGLPGSVLVSLGGDDREVASLGLYRVIAKSLIQAGKDEDISTLRDLANSIAKTKLLTSEQKASLKSLGSRAYHGKVTNDDLEICRPAEEMLARIASVNSLSFPSPIRVDDETREQAFDMLLTSMMRPSASSSDTKSNQ
ncbi:hypothetical protein [Planctomycetes bacterium K23_9]|uniref:Secreted protein n=1 Tax=Stieleria marina TaxID=1930275 RepID=A0A517NLW2_9BACT|nr:hypothetical protein K239x_00460 [Planctomycetes bacterium K23_9]